MFNHPPRRIVKPRAFYFSLGAIALTPSACEKLATARTDAADVLQLSAMEAKAVLPPDSCINPDLASATISEPPRTKTGDWINFEPPGNGRMRIVEYEKLDRLPTFALRKLPREGTSCRNPIQFHHPVFFESEEKNDMLRYEATVEFDNLCPSCGNGFSVTLVNGDKGWVVEKPGVIRTWTS